MKASCFDESELFHFLSLFVFSQDPQPAPICAFLAETPDVFFPRLISCSLYSLEVTTYALLGIRLTFGIVAIVI
jgi:hypothetical protein